MSNLEYAPDGYMWASELASLARQDEKAIIALCEQGIIDGVKLKDGWAVLVVRKTAPQAGKAIVRNLKAGGDIAIGAVIGRYQHIIVSDNKDRDKDRQQYSSQKPIRNNIDLARQWVRWTWYILAGGGAFFIVGLVFAIPVAAFVIIPGVTNASKSLRLAQKHGDKALIEEAKKINMQAVIVAVVLWGLIAISVVAGIVANS